MWPTKFTVVICLVGIHKIIHHHSGLELIIGGARSGKSALAEIRALEREAAGFSVHYIATGQSADIEMSERIRHHRARRPAHWLTQE